MEIPARVTLKVGETNTLRLPGLGTAGYLWSHEVVENNNLINVSSVIAGSSQVDGGSEFENIGSSRDELFVIRALRVGHSTIKFSQKRSWEHDQPPLKEYILAVDINN
jgi:predicted secreted protein